MMKDLLELAATGHLGAVRLGMPLSDAEAALGPGRPHPALRLRPNASGYPYHWGELSLFVADGRVDKIALEPELGAVEREEFLDSLRQKDITFEPWAALTHGNQIAVRTSAGAEVVFTQHDGGYYLIVLQVS
ncbi:hypothetical protein [Lentzea sp. NPDC051838]|uniref:hypothetical protein n=1 Tax=Lentzea sp. NPDC051838 TaxID=3154849 RepID=UPI0034273BA1